MSGDHDDIEPAGPMFWDRTGAPIGLEQWSGLYSDHTYRIVARDSVTHADRTYTVTTAWLGTDQSFGDRTPPLIFGTIGHHGDGDTADAEWLERSERFAATESDALDHHRDLVAQLERGALEL